LRKGLDDFEDLENVSEMVAETLESSPGKKIIKAKVLPVKTTRARVLPVQCKQHVHMHMQVQNLQFVISAEKATSQCEKCLAML